MTLRVNGGLFTPNDSVTVTITLTGGTFDLFDGHCEGRMGCIPILPINVMFVTVTVTESFGVNRPLNLRIGRFIDSTEQQLISGFKIQ